MASTRPSNEPHRPSLSGQHPVWAYVGLLTIALIWGAGFIAQTLGMEHVGPLTFNAARFTLAVAILAPLAWLISWQEEKAAQLPPSMNDAGTLPCGGMSGWRSGDSSASAPPHHHLPSGSTSTTAHFWRDSSICGLVLFFAFTAQQWGLLYTTAANAAFITGWYVVLTPIVVWLWRRIPPQRHTWLAMALSLPGMALLAWPPEGWAVNPGDVLELIGAVGWAMHVVLVERLGRQHGAIRLAVGQFAVAAALSWLAAALSEPITGFALLAAAPALLWSGGLSTALAFTLQIAVLQRVPSSRAVFILALEGIVAAVLGWWVLEQTMSATQIAGAALLTVAAVIAQRGNDTVAPSSFVPNDEPKAQLSR